MIILKNICKKIGQSEILKNISLEIQRGEFVAIIGQSGSGKTSLLNIIGTLDDFNSGSYIFDKYDVSKLNRDEKARLRRENIGFIFQRYNLLSLLNSRENVALPAVYAGKKNEFRKQRAKELLSGLELSLKTESKPNELSGGQQQRVSIARALNLKVKKLNEAYERSKANNFLTNTFFTNIFISNNIVNNNWDYMHTNKNIIMRRK